MLRHSQSAGSSAALQRHGSQAEVFPRQKCGKHFKDFASRETDGAQPHGLQLSGSRRL